MILPSKVFKQAIFVVIILFGAITATEVSFRVGGYQGNQFRSILFGDDLNSPLLFEESPLLWWKLRKNVMVPFLGKKVATDNLGLRVRTHDNTKQSENDYRVLCLGDSSTFGWRMEYDQTYPYLLKQRLKQTFRNVEVYNGGMPGYTSFQSLLLFESVVDRVKPQVVIIYSSNNENSLTQYSDRQRFKLTGRMLWLRMWLNRSLTYQFVKEVLIRAKPFKMTGTISLDQLSELSPRVSLSEYRENIIQIIKLARQKGIAPLLVTVPSHVGHPYLFKVPAKDPQVNALLERAEKRMMKGQYGSALADLEKARHLIPDYYQIHFLTGRLFQLMERDNGIAEYEKALECHPFPERLKKSYNEIILRTSAENKVPVVDLYTTFRDHLPGPEKLFVDACHPSPLGHNLIADSLSLPIVRILGTKKELGI
jgi:lysophospholipase L1-like esterase